MIDKLIEYFLRFPGIGPRQAKRFAYFLADQDENFLKDLSNAVLEIKNKIKQCPECFRFYEQEAGSQCSICSSKNRDSSLLMIVEKDADLEIVERAGAYNGKYFVLGSTLSLTGDKNDKERFKALFEKVKKNYDYENRCNC